MFRRIPWDEVLTDVRIAGMLLLAVGAAFLVARLLRMRRDETDRLAAMPLDND